MAYVQPSLDVADQLSAALVGARRGEDAGFRALYRAVQPGLLRYLAVLVGADAEDVASEAWLHIVRDLRSFRGDAGAFLAWAIAVARHRAIDHLRRYRRVPAETSPVEELIHLAARVDTEEEALTAISTDEALAVVATLPRREAEAVLLRVVIGLDAQTAARVLGIRAGAVRTAAYRGLRRLGDRMRGSA